MTLFVTLAYDIMSRDQLEQLLKLVVEALGYIIYSDKSYVTLPNQWMNILIRDTYHINYLVYLYDNTIIELKSITVDGNWSFKKWFGKIEATGHMVRPTIR